MFVEYLPHIGSFFEDRRGQTMFDFIIGITLFLFVILVTMMFVPDLVDPFEPDRDASSVLADRSADHISQNVLREDGEGPYILNAECTAAFFDERATDSCDVQHDEIDRIVGISERGNVHAVIVDNSGDAVELSTGGDTVTLETGGDIDNTADQNVYTATRIVTVDGDRYELIVQVW